MDKTPSVAKWEDVTIVMKGQSLTLMIEGKKREIDFKGVGFEDKRRVLTRTEVFL
jgi:hypothetical protein